MAKPITILIVDDEAPVCEALRGVLADDGFEARVAHSAEEGLAELARCHVDLVLLDVLMPGGMDGMEGLACIRREHPHAGVVMVSGHGTIGSAVRAMELGALDFIEKPPSLEGVLSRVRQALEKKRLREENESLRSELADRHRVVGESPALRAILQIVARVAPTNARVLIAGESGTGKELVARAIHRASRRAERPLLRVNCAAIPTELIEAELFGHERGAFTGAVGRRQGKFEQADGGTLFLDEVGDMSPHTQSKVLRVLEEGQFERIGGKETITVDVRVLAATHHSLPEDIAAGRFREDLYYRLNVVPILVPPLRERLEDVPLLAEHYLRRYCAENGRGAIHFSPDAMDCLRRYRWPGNVRELRNLVERLVIMTPGDCIRVEDLPAELHERLGPSPSAEHQTLRDARENFEADYIRRTLDETNWNVSEAARRLGIERTHLHRKMRTGDIRRDQSS
jgi:two-component system nitrogen regulation response regulator NtrX